LLPGLLSVAGCRQSRFSLENAYTQAHLQFSRGFVDQPLQEAESGYQASSRYPELNWKFRILAAEANLRKGRVPRALELLQPEPPPDLPEDVAWRRQLAQATAFCLSRQTTHAETNLDQAAALAGGRPARIAELNYVRGRCAIYGGEWDQAERYFRLLNDSSSISDPFLRTSALASLAFSLQKQQRYEEAIDWNNQALAAARSADAPPLEETILGNLGFLYAELRDFPNAQKNSAAAEALAEQLKNPADEQKWLIDLARVQLARGQSGAAEQSFYRALKIATSLNDNDVAEKALLNLSIVKLEQKNLDEAEKYQRQAFDPQLEGENLARWKLNEARLLTARGEFTKAISSLLDQLHQTADADKQSHNVRYLFRWYIQAALANAYAAENNDAEAEKWFQRSIDTIEEAANTMKHQEFQTAIRDNMPVFDDYVTFLVDHKQNEKALQVAQLGRARTLVPDDDGLRRPVNTQAWVASIQQYLRRNHAVLLAYFATTQDCYLWTLTGTQLRLSRLGITGPDLDILIDSYKSAIQRHASLSESTAAKRLFQILVQPALDLVPKGSHAMIVADSKIYSLNFETLVSSQGSDHYWLEDVDIQNVSSIHLLVRPNRKRSSTRGLLLIGAPAQADPHFPELPNAPLEMESVRKHFSPRDVTSVSGRDATPASYTNGSPGGYKYIYLATHGSANAMEPRKSAIILSPESNGTFKLLAQDIISPKLRLNAELVTISACEGAGTDVQSLEGLIGLEWAFMRAGAHQVVAALWDVDDAITPQLMDDFYDQLKQGRSASEALRHAKLRALKAGGKYATPYYWASLQLYTGS